MAMQKSMLKEFSWDQRYRVSGIEGVLTPALVTYQMSLPRTSSGPWSCWPANLIAGVCTSKREADHTLHALLGAASAISNARPRWSCLMACRSGAADVLFAYPAMGANARRARDIAQQFPDVRISILAENEETGFSNGAPAGWEFFST